MTRRERHAIQQLHETLDRNPELAEAIALIVRKHHHVTNESSGSDETRSRSSDSEHDEQARLVCSDSEPEDDHRSLRKKRAATRLSRASDWISARIHPRNPSAAFPTPKRARTSKKVTVLPFVVPEFDLTGLPQRNAANPYLPVNAAVVHQPRHRDQTLAEDVEMQTVGRSTDNASPSLCFPAVLAAIVMIFPLVLVTFLMAFLLEWRGGVENGWKGDPR
ncbi:hypothetical protein ACM66B_002573 [Microbotryomycetes sp. NB124-2]